ncbi:MAG: hypothetical protein OXU31_01550 [Gammaproteobacteria bacterium]|nr:hypothetical protein [Gammaproteobacteria bacterium]MDD9850613.1 hypothetical protein [Gammaproteobacteria bacterium]
MNTAATIGLISTIEPLVLSIAAIFSTAAICGSAFAFWWERATKRQKLISAVYWHVKFTQENLERLKGAFNGLSDKMRANEHFTPYPVISREDNLAYADIIELMRSLKNEKQEKIILRYFHAQANLHAMAASFGTEVGRNLPLEQKIRMMDGLAKFCDETLEHAAAAEEFLRKKTKSET